MKKSFVAAVMLAVSMLFTFNSCSNILKNPEQTVEQCTVTFDGNGGSVSSSTITVFAGSPLGYLPKAVRDGFDFSGWNTKRDGSGSTAKIGTIISSDITLYAQWGTNLLSVEYYPNYPDGAEVKKITDKFSKGFVYQINTCSFSYSGYNFTGWNTESDGSGTDWSPLTDYYDSENLRLYAQWTPAYGHIYTVKHYQQNVDGSYPENPIETNTYSGYTDSTYTATRKSYTGFNIPAAQTITIKADNSASVSYYYERKTVTLSFNPNGGNFPVEYPLSQAGTFEVTGLYGSTFTIPFVSRDGYDYSWSPTLTNTYMPSTNKTYTANWTLRKHTITYNLEGGNFISTFTPKTTFTELESVTLPVRADIIKDGYAFAGWYEDRDCLGTRVYSWTPGLKKSDIVLYVKWVEVSNTWGGMKEIDASWYDPAKEKFVLKSAEEFAGMASLINKGTNFTGKTIEMDFDLILNEDHLNYLSWGTNPPSNIWTGLGKQGRAFSGILDGKGHSVYGMYMDSATITTENCGFIGESKGATIKNLNIVDCYIKSTKKRTGGIVGYATSGTVIENCSTSGYITSTQGSVGGIIGVSSAYETNSRQNVIMNCTNNAEIFSNVTSGNIAWVGGIASTVWGKAFFYDCTNNGKVYSKYRSCGGIVGCVSDYSDIGIVNCQNTGEITVENYGAGGITGGVFNNSTTYHLRILNCSNSGKITALKYGAGGITGEAPIYTYIYNCSNDGNISAPQSSGGIVGYGNRYETIQNCVNNGVVTSTNSSLSGGIEGNQRYTGSNISYSYNNSTGCVRLIGTGNLGAITGCGTFNSSSSVVSLLANITSGTQGAVYTYTYANNSTTTVLEALNDYTSTNSSILIGASTYDIKPWAADTNGIPRLQY